MRVTHKSSVGKKLLIVAGIIVVLFVVMFAASYPESQRVKAAELLQRGCETAKSEIATRRKEHETQTTLFNQNNKRELDAVNATLASLGTIIGSMSYNDSTARVGASSELSVQQTKLNNLQKESDIFKVKHQSEWDKINSTEKTLYDCTNDTAVNIDQTKTDKYDAAIKTAGTPIKLGD